METPKSPCRTLLAQVKNRSAAGHLIPNILQYFLFVRAKWRRQRRHMIELDRLVMPSIGKKRGLQLR